MEKSTNPSTVANAELKNTSSSPFSVTNEPVSPPVIAPPATTLPSYAKGEVTGFGSIYLNGVRYDTQSAVFSTDDKKGITEKHLDVGMVVHLKGSVSSDGKNGIATHVHIQEQALGPIDAPVDLQNKRLTVLGQGVVYDALTSKADVDLAQLVRGDVLAISGFYRANGKLYATRIAQVIASPKSQYKLLGKISQLNTVAKTFRLGELTVHYPSAEFKSMKESDLAKGKVVRITGNAAQYDPSTQTFTVRYVTADILPPMKNDYASIEGFVTRFISPSKFSVDHWRVHVDDNTQFDDGNDANMITMNTRMKVKGKLTKRGVLIADDVKIFKGSPIAFQGRISEIQRDLHQITVLGLNLQINPHTKMHDLSSANDRYLELIDLNANDQVMLKGYQNRAGELVVGTLERLNPTPRKNQIYGAVTSNKGNCLEMLGRQILISQQTTFDGLSGVQEIKPRRLLTIELRKEANTLIAQHIMTHEMTLP